MPFLLSGVLYDVTFTLIRRTLARENIARAHNGHLYQVVRRSGLDARWVALIHWGFAVIGGLTAIAFLNTTAWERIAIGLAPLAVQLAWTDYVIRRARAAGIEKW